MKKIKNLKNYWPLVKDMSQITLLLGVFLIASYKAINAGDVEAAKIWGGVAIAAFLFSIVPMWFEMAKAKLPKSK